MATEDVQGRLLRAFGPRWSEQVQALPPETRSVALLAGAARLAGTGEARWLQRHARSIANLSALHAELKGGGLWPWLLEPRVGDDD